MAVHCGNQSCAEVDNSKKLSPVNILSVDFDWIMAPSIEIYNNMVGGDRYPWDEIRDRCPGARFDCDFERYKKLCIYLGNIVKTLPKDHLKHAQDHGAIVDACKDWSINQHTYNLYNIDHHHDCGYNNKENPTIEDLCSGVTCANWVLMLTKECPNCQSYIWINNYNSNSAILDPAFDNMPPFTQTSDINAINYVDFNYVFICKSEPWVPPQYYPLYEGLLELLENLINK